MCLETNIFFSPVFREDEGMEPKGHSVVPGPRDKAEPSHRLVHHIHHNRQPADEE